jgi:phage shock protein A
MRDWGSRAWEARSQRPAHPPTRPRPPPLQAETLEEKKAVEGQLRASIAQKAALEQQLTELKQQVAEGKKKVAESKVGAEVAVAWCVLLPQH